ncbi:MAG: septal ring lytic transglycosylase RlpA family protein, partial [Candidatus Kapabacteria bacterium]|nr:septal ring lytic transglycosylase RlpA family protein [Candidatus Kapabacteria bacterium]
MSCSSVVRFSSSTDASGEGKTGSKTGETLPAGTVLMGKASYYGNEFHGRTTANGEIYDMYKISAAHKTLAFGTMVKVRNLNNNKEIVVRINDRGPFVPGRIID